MNYENLYYTFINEFKSQEIPEGTYTEKHHIRPRYMGGKDSKENLVVLTFRQHVFVHHLWAKATNHTAAWVAYKLMSGTIVEDGAPVRGWTDKKHTEEFKKARSRKYKERFKNDQKSKEEILRAQKYANELKIKRAEEFSLMVISSSSRNEEYLKKKSNKSLNYFISPEGLMFESPIFAAKYYGNVKPYIVENWCKRGQHGWSRILKERLQPNDLQKRKRL